MSTTTTTKRASRLTREAKQRMEELRMDAYNDPWVVLTPRGVNRATATTSTSGSGSGKDTVSPPSLSPSPTSTASFLFRSISPRVSEKKSKKKDDDDIQATFSPDGYSKLHAISVSSSTSIELIRMCVHASFLSV
jgi:hypothetical protein